MSEDDAEYTLVMPFWIDTDGYSDRDREMFVCGYEFAIIHAILRRGSHVNCPIHRENESRVRMMWGRFGVEYTINQHSGYDGCETWSELSVSANGTPK